MLWPDNSTAAEVEALILNQPESNPYEKLKTELIKAFGRSTEEKNMALLNLNSLGNKFIIAMHEFTKI
jgi:hypothetical protein